MNHASIVSVDMKVQQTSVTLSTLGGSTKSPPDSGYKSPKQQQKNERLLMEIAVVKNIQLSSTLQGLTGT